MPTYGIKCGCGFKWSQAAADKTTLRCPRERIQPGPMSLLGAKGHVLTARLLRSDAKKPPKNLNQHSAIAFSRPKRLVADRKRTDFHFDGVDDNDDGGVVPMDVGEDDPDDPPYLPAPEFNPEMRFSDGGTFAPRVVNVPLWTKETPWTTIKPSQGRGSQDAAMGGRSADSVGLPYCPMMPKPKCGSRFEWCHLIADCLGGPTTENNLVCGSNYANTAQLCIERLLVGKSHLEVSVRAELRLGTDLCELITYRIRATGRTGEFQEQIDGLATGCTAVAGRDLQTRLREWLNANKTAKKRKVKTGG